MLWHAAFSLQWPTLPWCTGSRQVGSAAEVKGHSFSCPKACGIFLNQESKPYTCIGKQTPHHWTTREVLTMNFKLMLGERASGIICFWEKGSVQFSCSVMSDSLWPRGLQHAKLPYPSPTPGACLNSCPSSWWCHPTISSSVIPFSYLQSFPASQSFPMIQFFTSSGQNNGVSASASVLPMNIQDWFPLGLIGLISLLSKELSRVFSKGYNDIEELHVPRLYFWRYSTLSNIGELSNSYYVAVRVGEKNNEKHLETA